MERVFTTKGAKVKKIIQMAISVFFVPFVVIIDFFDLDKLSSVRGHEGGAS